jgi:hypothetical protein
MTCCPIAFRIHRYESFYRKKKNYYLNAKEKKIRVSPVVVMGLVVEEEPAREGYMMLKNP